jgi:hypothetical protein
MVQIGRMTGSLVFPPRDCPCQGYGLKARKGKRLANVVVQAVRRGRVVATSDAARTLVEGGGPKDLGYAYAFAPDVRSLPRGTTLRVYGLYVNA